MLRKDFIKAGTLLTMSAALGRVQASDLKNTPTESNRFEPLKKGLVYGMIREELTILDKFKLIKDLGFHGVELDSPVDVPLDELLDAQVRTGIEIPSVINRDHWKSPLSDVDSSVRQVTIDSVKKAMDEVKILGGDTVLVVPGVVNEKLSYKTAYQNSIQSIRQLIPHAEKTGVKIGLENVWNNFLISPVEALNFLNEIDHPLVGWYFDIGNIMRYGWPQHWLEILEGRIVKLHAKEFSRKKMMEEGLGKGFGVELGQGDIDWSLVMKTLKQTNHQGGWMTLEVGGGDRQHLAKLSKQLDDIINL